MKKVFLFVVCAASFAVVNAQAKFGVKAGANLANVVGDDAEDAKMKVGFHVGALAQVPITTNFVFQPEVVFSAQGAKFEEGGDDYKLNLNYINVPLLAKFVSTSGFTAETGPQIGFLMSAKAKGDGESVDVKDGFKKTDFSWALGLGYQSPAGFGVNARYNLGLSKLADDGDAKVKNGVIQVGVFYLFGGGAR